MAFGRLWPPRFLGLHLGTGFFGILVGTIYPRASSPRPTAVALPILGTCPLAEPGESTSAAAGCLEVCRAWVHFQDSLREVPPGFLAVFCAGVAGGLLGGWLVWLLVRQHISRAARTAKVRLSGYATP